MIFRPEPVPGWAGSSTTGLRQSVKRDRGRSAGRVRRCLVVAVTMAGLLAGCGGGQADSPGDSSDADLMLTATEFAFEPSAPTVDGGQVTVAIDNEGSVPHTWVVEGMEDQLKLEADAGQVDSGTIELAPGAYTFYCEVPGHREAGMEGAVTVE